MADGTAAYTVSASTADTGIVIGDVIGMSDATATIAAVGGAGATVIVTKVIGDRALIRRGLYLFSNAHARAQPQAGTSLSYTR
jgi:hypothetical protein